MPKIAKEELIEKRIIEYEHACEGIDTYQHFKKLDFWTLDEGLKLLIAPNERGQKSEGEYPLLFDIDFLQNSKRYETVTRAINKSLTVEGNYEEKILEYKNSGAKKTISNFWYYCYARLKVNPFDFLEFIKRKNIFKIPPELKFIKNPSSGNVQQYIWASDYPKSELEKSVKSESESEKTNTSGETYNNDNVIIIDLNDDKVSKELKIALQAWKAVYTEDEGLNKKYGHIDNIKKWLFANHSKLTDSAVKRICTIININKKGGAVKQR